MSHTRSKSGSLYAGLLRLHTLSPSPWQRGIFFEGSLFVGVVLSLGDLASAWVILVLPLAVAAAVKLCDLTATQLRHEQRLRPSVTQLAPAPWAGPAAQGHAPVAAPTTRLSEAPTPQTPAPGLAAPGLAASGLEAPARGAGLSSIGSPGSPPPGLDAPGLGELGSKVPAPTTADAATSEPAGWPVDPLGPVDLDLPGLVLRRSVPLPAQTLSEFLAAADTETPVLAAVTEDAAAAAVTAGATPAESDPGERSLTAGPISGRDRQRTSQPSDPATRRSPTPVPGGPAGSVATSPPARLTRGPLTRPALVAAARRASAVRGAPSGDATPGAGAFHPTARQVPEAAARRPRSPSPRPGARRQPPGE